MATVLTSERDTRAGFVRERRRDLVRRAVILTLAAWTAVQSVRYVTGAGAARYHVESAALLFIAVATVLRLRGGSGGGGAAPAAPPAWTIALWWLAALALYRPALSLGFLSDDYALSELAFRFHVGLVTPQLFRPLPLVLWGAILRAGGGAWSLHLLTLVVHGTNAYLTTRVVAPYVGSRAAAMMAGAVVVSFPLAPEAVVWMSGVFDVMATTWMLTAVLLARRYRLSPSPGVRVQLYACAFAGLLSKETAVVLPLLIAMDMWSLDRRSRALAIDVGVLLGIGAVVGTIRLALAPAAMTHPIDKFLLQRWLFGTFGAAVLPWHARVMSRLPWLVAVEAVTVVALATAFFLRRNGDRRFRDAATMAAWMVVTTLPVAARLGVSPDLQGARYLYLPVIGWAGLLARVAVFDAAARARWIAVASVALILATHIVGLQLHLTPWRDAADLRDRIERAAAGDSRIARCTVISLFHLPDSVEGAYLFRNGAAEAFRRDVGVHVSGEAGPGCAFAWNDRRAAFEPAPLDLREPYD